MISEGTDMSPHPVHGYENLVDLKNQSGVIDKTLDH
jgi:hypothetical protein